MGPNNGSRKAILQEGITRTPFPGSRKVYVGGGEHHVHVPMREIQLNPTKTGNGQEENAPFTVYDTSGPYTDPTATIDLRKGLSPLRKDWIEKRGDAEEVAGFYKGKAAEGVEVFPGAQGRKPLKAKAGK